MTHITFKNPSDYQDCKVSAVVDDQHFLIKDMTVGAGGEVRFKDVIRGSLKVTFELGAWPPEVIEKPTSLDDELFQEAFQIYNDLDNAGAGYTRSFGALPADEQKPYIEMARKRRVKP